ncbi:bifunctional diguanylate cyclase/phosphodiesterase [Aureimonas sp. SK2]|uniref:putative bifunctional diguanylate cyclase/phosphodiesterase n=1 Tax=Aureimonas sp. SK2 TaxID=3015992 RepID=UPI00244382BD|nr:EAL domain-containing protein [Aureimonas sp. SK2]
MESQDLPDNVVNVIIGTGHLMVLRAFQWLTLSSVDPDVAAKQFDELRSQVPLLYALLSVNAMALGYTHMGVAPAWMSVWVPGALAAVSGIRAVTWLRYDPLDFDRAAVLRILRRTILLGCLLSVAYIVWALGLTRFGGPDERAHVAMFVGITVIGCIFCLSHLPQGAILVAASTTVPYFFYYLVLSPSPVYIAIALNILLVSLVALRVLLNGFSAFAKLVRSQTEMDRLNREVTVLAHTDMLTGLPNRRLFFSEVEARLAGRTAASPPLAFGVIDLDRFKAANDTFGHIIGDRILTEVGQRLTAEFSRTESVARVGGDEFAFLIEADGETAMRRLDELCRRLSEPYCRDDVSVSIGASCGVALADIPNEMTDSLYERADYALYQSKSARRGQPTLYSAAHEAAVRSDRAIEAALQGADLDSELCVHLQPVIDARTHRVSAVEALARWSSPTLGAISPAVFIPVAERAGLVHRLTVKLFEKTLEGAARLPETVSICFNLSAHDLTSPGTILSLVSRLRQSGIAPARIVFELTETAMLRDFAAARESLGLLNAMGAQVAIDDFGTGHASLSYLRELPIGRVKIDRSFVSGDNALARRDLLGAIIAMCRSLDLPCIAEGVETEEQREFLRSAGCDALQGYLIARPMPPAAFFDWMADLTTAPEKVPVPAALAEASAGR